MRDNAYTTREPICPENWADLDGWRGEPAEFIRPIINTITGELAAEGFDAYWLIQDFHRAMKIEPYISLGIRPAGAANKSILIAFGFAYATARTWPEGFAVHYAERICHFYKDFEKGFFMPPTDPANYLLKEFCEGFGVQRINWVLPANHFASDPKPARDPFDFEDEEPVGTFTCNTRNDPFDALEQEDPLS